MEGTGVSPDPETARLSAIGEALERYCSAAPAHCFQLVRAPFSDLEDEALHPRFVALLSEQQYRRFPALAPLTERKVIDWSWAFSLTRERPVLVPASLVHFSCVGRGPNNFLPELSTTGLACHVDLSQAILAGVCEVLERDALAIWWHNRLPLVPLDVAGTDAAELLAGPLAASGAEFSLFGLPTDTRLPVVLAVARTRDAWPHAVVGCACRENPVAAASRALCEAAQMLFRQRRRPSRRLSSIRSFNDHADFYGGAEGAGLLDQILSPLERPAHLSTLSVSNRHALGDDGLKRLDTVLSRVARAGLEVLVADMTTEDVALAGFFVVRVIVPGTVDMSADERYPRLGARRLYELPAHLGLRVEPATESELNLLPVPLA
ncbi:MAG: YcaO-like family protein [Actinomycetota bacterium]|nr:YcaO-like family protein [Actinomycetota bacterium]